MSASPAIASLAAKAILVVNSSVTQSLTDATTYCGLRDIPTANIRSFTFGTLENVAQFAGLQSATSPGYISGTQVIQSIAAYNGIASGSSLLTVLDNEIKSYGALCVLFSTYTPTRVLCTAGAGSGYFALPAIAAAARVTLTWPQLTAAGLTGFGVTPATTLAAINANVIPSAWSSAATLRPHGRIGCPDLTTSSAFAELPLASGSTTVLGNAVANAIASEARNNLTLPIHYSSVDTCLTPGANVAYSSYVASQGFGNTVDTGNSGTNGTFGYMFSRTNPISSPLPAMWSALWLMGLNQASDGVTNYGAYAYNIPGSNSSTTLGFDNNYLLAPGAFGGCWYSYSYNFGMNLLYNGASAAVMSVGEPFSNNIAYGGEIFHFLLNQRVPICLANFYSPTQTGDAVIGTTVFGDPLYAPFKSTYTPRWGVGKGLMGTHPPLKIGVS